MLGVKKSILILTCLLAPAAYVGFPPSEAREAATAAPQQSLGAKERASFPHETKDHRKLDCSRCHRVSTAQPDVRYFPGHATCISCHNFAFEAFNKPVTFCGICHEGRPVSRARSALFEFPKPRVGSDFGIDFSHPSHRKPLPADARIAQVSSATAGFFETQIAPGQAPRCTDCHRRVEPVRSGMPEMTIETGHSTCFKCHGENPVKPPNMNQCAECHQLDGPHSPHLFGIVKEFKHADHDYDIRPRRKSEYRMAKAPDFLCSECHQSVERAEKLSDIKLPEANYCASCHNGRIGLPDALATNVLNSLKGR